MNKDILQAMRDVLNDFRNMSDEEYFSKFKQIELSSVGRMVIDSLEFMDFLENDQWSAVTYGYKKFSQNSTIKSQFKKYENIHTTSLNLNNTNKTIMVA